MIKLYNSLKKEKQVFAPIDPAHIRLYGCGPTVYNYAHIGNARMAVVFELWARVLRTAYPRVTYVSNITDIEDKIIEAARQSGDSIKSITEKYAQIYNEDMAALGAALPDIQPKATDHIAEMITLIARLIDRGHAYAAQGHVLFSVPSAPRYGVLSGRSRDEQIAGARIEVAPYKKDPADFVLWKPSTGDEPGWESPWGFGRPGWHIECSAMAEKHLGLPFDIHGGGADLKFPHHENEIAQSCCAHGHEESPESFAKYWVHNGFLTVEGEKMSKSLGNFKLVHDLLEQHPGEVLRLTLLSAHYRQPLDWSESLVTQNKKALDKFYTVLLRDSRYAGLNVPDNKIKPYPPLLDALYDDLNTPLAISKLHELSSAMADPDLDADKRTELKGFMIGSGKLMGLLQSDEKSWFQKFGSDAKDTEKIEFLVAQRQAAKKEKNFAQADSIRAKLDDMGIIIEDTPGGPVWRYK